MVKREDLIERRERLLDELNEIDGILKESEIPPDMKRERESELKMLKERKAVLNEKLKEGLAGLKKTLDDPHDLLKVFEKSINDPEVKCNLIIRQMNTVLDRLQEQEDEIRHLKCMLTELNHRLHGKSQGKSRKRKAK